MSSFKALLAVFLLMFSGASIASAPVGCGLDVSDSNNWVSISEWAPGVAGSPNPPQSFHYAGCRAPDGVVWRQGISPGKVLDLSSSSSNATHATGPSYATSQAAMDAVRDVVVSNLGNSLDPSLGGCPDCKVYTPADLAMIYGNPSYGCDPIDNTQPISHNMCATGQTSPPSTTDPTLFAGAEVFVINATGFTVNPAQGGVSTAFRMTSTFGVYSDDYVVNFPVCTGDWRPALGTDSNGKVVLACFLPALSAKASTVSGLDVTSTGACASCNPVNLATGSKMDYAEDYRNHSPFPIVWDRYYHSDVGGWRFGYERSLKKWTNGGGIEKIMALRPDGASLLFEHTGSNTDPWVVSANNATAGILSRLTNALSGGVVVGYDYVNLLDETEHYDIDGRLIQISNRAGMTIDLDYDASGNLIRVDDSFGRYLDITRTTISGTSWISSITDGDRTVSYAQSIPTGSAFGRVLLNQVTQNDATAVQYVYDEGGTPGRGLLTGIVDQNSARKATYTYDSENRVTSSVHDPDFLSANTINYEYDTTDVPGRPTKITWNGVSSYLAGSGIATVHKGGGFDLPCLVCSGGEAEIIQYDSQGNPTKSVDHKGVETWSTYDTARGLPTLIKEAKNSGVRRDTQITWNTSFRLPAVIVEPVVVGGVLHTKTTTLTYDSHGLLTGMVVSTSSGEPSRSWAYTYNSQKLLETVTAPGNRTTTYAYDTSGNLLSVENAAGQETTYGNYTSDGLSRLVSDPNGLQTKLTYDNMRRLTKVERGSASTHWETTDISYDIFGDVSRVDMPNGDWAEYTYDSVHRLRNIQSPTGNRTFALDSYGRITHTAIQDNNYGWMWWRFLNYDRTDHVIKAWGSQSNTEYEYDDEGNQIAANDIYQGTLVEHSHDELGRLTSILDENSNSFGLSYDPQDHLEVATDSRGNSTAYSYNGFGDMVGLSSPDAGTQGFTVNANGEMLTKVDARGATTTISRDSLGRATQIVYDDSGVPSSAAGFKFGSETQTFSYDSCANGIGRLCSMADASGTTTYAYDLWGRMTAKGFTPSGTTLSLDVAYTYDAGGEMSSIQYPSGRVLDVGHDEGDATSLSYDGYDILHGATYRPFHGKSLGWEWGGGLGYLNYGYNPENQQKSITSTQVDKSAHYGGVGRISSISDNLDDTHGSSYYRDNTDNLTYAYLYNRPDGLFYSYDENGNRINTQDDSYNYTDYAIDSASNRLTSITQNGGTPQDWLYDDSGNLIEDPINQYKYDAKGRMAEVNSGGSIITYAYNGQGERVRKSRVNAPNIGSDYFVYDEEGHLIGVYDATGAVREELVWFDGWRPVATIRPSTGSSYEIYRITSDQVGAPLVVQDDNGTKVWEWDAREPFGFQLPNQDPDADSNYFYLNLRFPGQWLDVETGLYHNGFRDYSSKAGRYVQSDPLGLSGGWNTYSYVSNNPAVAIDPLGLEEVMVAVWNAAVYRNKNVDAGFTLEPGHVFVGDKDTRTFTNQWPKSAVSGASSTSQNITATWGETVGRFGLEGRMPDSIYYVEIPDMDAFHKQASREQKKGLWQALPSGSSTNCSVAAYNVLSAGGVSLPSEAYARLPFVVAPMSIPRLPTTLSIELKALSLLPGSGVRVGR